MGVVFLFLGVAGGLLGGMGMGGGSLLVPLCVLAGMGQRHAQWVCLVSFVPMAVVSAVILFKKGLIDINIIFYPILSSTLFSVVGGLVAFWVKERCLVKIYGWFLLCCSLVFLFGVLKRKNA